jgi:hypothetical protein
MLAEEIWEPGTATGAGATALELGDYYHPRAAALGIGFGSLLLLPFCAANKNQTLFSSCPFRLGAQALVFLLFCFVFASWESGELFGVARESLLVVVAVQLLRPARLLGKKREIKRNIWIDGEGWIGME